MMGRVRPQGGGGGQGTPNPLNTPFGPPGGGNPGRGCCNPGGNPRGGGRGNPAPPHDKLSGQQPVIFDGDQRKSEAFIQEWNIY